MTESIEIPVHFNGEERTFPAEFQFLGYTHRFQVMIAGQPVTFEPDEERNYRAVLEPQQQNQPVQVELLKAIAAAIESFMK